jgi:hypothetical protein
MPQSLLTGQLKEKPTYRVRCLYSSFVHGYELRMRDGGSEDPIDTKLRLAGWMQSEF